MIKNNKTNKKQSSQRRCKPLFLVGLMFIMSLFLLSSVAAWDWDNTKTETGIHPVTGLPTIEVKNLFGLGETLFEGSVSEHTEECGTNCYSKLEFNHSGGVLIDDIRFLTEQEDGSWVEQDIRSYKFLRETGGQKIDVDDYELQCEDGVYNTENSSYEQICNNVLVGSHKENAPEFTEYRVGDELPEGYYEMFLEGEKKPSRTVDWQIKIQGKWLDEWAIWTGGDANLLINLNSYYKFDSNNFSDETGNEVDATNGGTTNDTGIVNDGRFFDGGSDIITLNGNNIAGNPAFSHAMWVKPMGISEGELLYAPVPVGANDPTGAFFPMRQADGTVRIVLYSNQYIESSLTLPNNTFTHLTITKAAGTPASSVKMYFDGVEDTSLTVVGGTSTPNYGSQDILLGQEILGFGGYAFHGVLDEVAIYTYVLSAANVSSLYNINNVGGSYPFNSSFLTLNSPADDSVSSTPEVTFNATAEVVGGATLTNMSLWTNATGTWALSNTTNANVPDIHYKFNNNLNQDGSGSVTETTKGTIQYETGVINQAYEPDASNNFKIDNTPLLDFGTGDLTIALWYQISSDANRKIIYDAGNLVINYDSVDGDKMKVNDGTGTILSYSNSSNYNNQYHHLVWKREGSNNTLWIDGILRDTASSSNSITTGDVEIGQYSGGLEPIQGMDDLRIYKGTALTDSQIQILYNSGSGTEGGVSTSLTTTWNKTITDTTIWNVEACDTDGDCGFATSNYSVSLDATAPTFSVESPTGLLDYGYVNGSEEVNVTFTDSNLDSCWYDYNGTNITIEGCLTGVKNSTSITLEDGNYNITFYANDSVGNLNSTSTNWSYKVFEPNRILNNQSYETESETFSINLTANSSLTAVTLDYNGTEYAATQSGTVWNKTFDILTTSIGNNTVRWKFTYGAETIYSYNSSQQVNETVFTICNASYTDEFLNVTFKDEATLGAINSSIPLAQFEYYLGSGDVTKTYEYINAGSEEANYTFCATPARTLHVDPYIQYSASGYPQRIWDQTLTDYTTSMTTQILYLLGSADGLYTTLQTINSADQTISGVLIEVVRSISGSDVTVASGTTNDAGAVTYWLNPDFVHDFTLSKTGFTTYETSFAPTQTSYTFTLGGTDGNEVNSTQRGIDYEISPTIGTLLYNGTEYDFTYTLTSGYYDVTDYGFNLRLSNGTEIDGGNTGTEGTELSLTYNTQNESYIYIDYYWTVNDETVNRSDFWIVQNTQYTGWSIKTFADDFSSYLAAGIFGLDDFGRLLITFMILFFSVGIMSYKYGFSSPMAINTLVFAVVFFLDIALGLIPTIRGINNLPTYVAGIILVITVIREGQR